MPIWRILADNTANWLAIELRDVTTYQVNYFVIDLQERNLFKQNFLFKDPWWTGITNIQDNKLIFHEFQNSDNPEKKNIYIYDMLTNKNCWKSQELVFSALEKNEIYGFEKSKEGKRNYKKISIVNFSKQEVSQEEFDLKIRKLTEEQKKNKDIAYPFHYPETHKYFASVAEFLKQFLHVHPIKGCDYLEHKRAVLISYYLYKEKLITNNLLVINHKQEVLLHENLGNGLEGIGVDTFVVLKNRLIFIKEKYQLISYALDNGQ